MPKLVVKFNDSVLEEKWMDRNDIRIGRSPGNGLVIDNPAVSHYHARMFHEDGCLMLEDFGSLNGTFVNGQRVKMVTLKPGDSVAIGKHTILVAESYGIEGFSARNEESKPAIPKVEETIMLGTKERREFIEKVAAAGERSQISPGRLKVPTLLVQKGKTNQREYMLSDKLTVIGKSSMATVKLRGWFAPKAAAQITRREDNSYYIGGVGKVPTINGSLIVRPTRLSPGDIIEVAGIQIEFNYRD